MDKAQMEKNAHERALSMHRMKNSSYLTHPFPPLSS